MMAETSFKFGDRLLHSSKPEWGIGTVSAVQNIQEDGVSCQRLTIRFDRAGLKTITTAHAQLALAMDEPPIAAHLAEGSGNGWLDQMEKGSVEEVMSRLPENTRDPFLSLQARIEHTLKLYRFSTQGGALLDWAAAQTGLKDPMTRFNRHELELLFNRWAAERDSHLKKLVIEARRNESAMVDRVLNAGPSAARDALRKLHALR